MMTSAQVTILTTAHWSGDARLNRHVDYLERVGHRVVLTSFAGVPRVLALIRALVSIARNRARTVIVPDPELFVLGSLIARLFGKRAIIDIHEDYAKVAMARKWVPKVLRPLVGAVAAINTRVGRTLAWRTLVAAPELKQSGDYLALNLPDPSTLDPSSSDGSRRLIYVGDLTLARGAIAMVETLALLDDSFELTLVGNAAEDIAETIIQTSLSKGVSERVRMTGRQPHALAWEMAAGSLAGFNLLQDVPAYREAVATKLWEYMAVSIPPIVTNLPGQRRVVAQLDEDLICGTESAAAAAISALAQDPERRKRLGDAARSLVETTWEACRPDLVVQSIVEP